MHTHIKIDYLIKNPVHALAILCRKHYSDTEMHLKKQLAIPYINTLCIGSLA